MLLVMPDQLAHDSGSSSHISRILMTSSPMCRPRSLSRADEDVLKAVQGCRAAPGDVQLVLEPACAELLEKRPERRTLALEVVVILDRHLSDAPEGPARTELAEDRVLAALDIDLHEFDLTSVDEGRQTP